MTTVLVNPTLRRLHLELAQVSDAFADMAGALTPVQLRWRPDPGAWGIAHCLDHLVATSRAYEPELEAALARARRRSVRAEAGLQPGVVGRWLLSVVGPEARSKRLSCPRVLAPADGPNADVLATFLTGQRRLRAYLEAADGLDINARAVRTPASRLLRVSLGEAFALATSHAQRHLEQARRVRAHPRFPVAFG